MAQPLRTTLSLATEDVDLERAYEEQVSAAITHLLEAGADSRAADFKGLTALQLARQREGQYPAVVKLLTDVEKPMPPISLINKLTLLHKDNTYIIGKSSYSAIARSPSVGALRQVAADAIGIDDAHEHVLFFEDRELTDDSRDCRDEGLKDSTFILCRNWGDLEPQDAGESSSDDSPIRASRGRHWSEQWPLERVLSWLCQ